METSIVLLAITTSLTSLSVEAVKKTFSLDSKKISYNILAAVISVICGLFVSLAYIIIADISVTPQIIIYIICLVLASWISSMVSYDKVIQTINSLNAIKSSK